MDKIIYGDSLEIMKSMPSESIDLLVTSPPYNLKNSTGNGMKNEHPVPFPVQLIDRIITSTNAQIILDPFMGSGTTAITAMGNSRDFIGIDISPDYCQMAEKRIERNKIQSELVPLK